MMTKMAQPVTVTVAANDGRPVNIVVRPPNPAVNRQIDRAGRKAYVEAVRAGVPKDRHAGADHLAFEGDAAWRPLREFLHSGAEQLGRQDLPLAERQRLALDMREQRSRLTAEIAEALRRKPTADSLAAQAQLETLVTLCVHAEAGHRLFRSPEDYRERAGDPFCYRIAQAVTHVLYGFDYSEPPEDQFLREHPLAV
jgi:hypothetical protein